MHSDWIIYTGKQHFGIGRIRKDGTDEQCFFYDPSIQTMGTNIAGDWIYYDKFEIEQPMHQYKMKIDGTENQAIPKAFESE